MGTTEQAVSRKKVWLWLPPVLVAAAFLVFDPLPQDEAYHQFADTRGISVIPNFGDVMSNLAFLLSGALGLTVCLRGGWPGARISWLFFFLGVVAVCAGSGWYHWQPNSNSLIWDRLPMTIGFMGLYVAMLSEYVDRRSECALLGPAVALGIASVALWAEFNDLRLYYGVQGLVFASAVLILLLFSGQWGQGPYIVAGLAFYAAAILFEQLDHQVFQATGGVISGHTIKHLFAGAAPLWAWYMLRIRARRFGAGPGNQFP